MPFQTVELTDFQEKKTYVWKFEFEEEDSNTLYKADRKSMDLYNKINQEFKKEFYQGRQDENIKAQEIERDTHGTFSFLHLGVRRVKENWTPYKNQIIPNQEQIAHIEHFINIYEEIVSIQGEPDESKNIQIGEFYWP